MTYGILLLGPEKHIRSIAVICIFMAVILSIFKAKKHYLPKIFFAYFLILSFISINYLLTGPGFNNITGLMDIKGIGPWLCLGLIFVSYDNFRYELFKKFLIISVLFISIFVIYNLSEFGIGLYRGQALAKYRVYATNMVWISPFVFLIFKNNKKLLPIRILAIFIGVATALITQTRSFLLIYMLILIFDFSQTRKKPIYIIGASIVSLLSIYMVLNIEFFNSSFGLIQERGMDDTRSSQLIEFLSQLNFIELVVGKGFDSIWYFGGQPYAYLDNQWLLLIWWAGLIPALMYFYLTAIIPFILFFKKNQDYETKVESLVLILWTLACAGLAIFSTMSVDFFFFIICIIQGRLLNKYSMNSENR